MNLTERLQEAFDKRVCGTAMLPTSDLLSAMTAIEQAESQYNQISSVLDNTERDKEALEETIAQQAEAIRLKDEALIAVRDDLEIRMRIAEDDSLNISNSVLDQMCDAIDLQPSPEILQARDEKVQRQAYERAAEVCEHFAENGVCHTNYPEEAFAGDCAVAIRALIKGDGK